MRKSVLAIISVILVTVSALLHALEEGPEPVTVLFTSDTEGKIKPYG